MITPDDIVIQLLEENGYVLEEASELPRVGPQFTKPGIFSNLDKDHWVRTEDGTTRCIVYWVLDNIIEFYMDVMQAEDACIKPTAMQRIAYRTSTTQRIAYRTSSWNLADPNSLESMAEFVNQKLR